MINKFKELLSNKGEGGVLAPKKAEKFQEEVLEKMTNLIDSIDEQIDEDGIPMSSWESIQQRSNTIISELNKILTSLK